jgi:hypothetical protein
MTIKSKSTKSESKLLDIIFYYMEKSPSKTVYLPLKFLCSKLKITDRQLRTIRNEISHIFLSKWRKATKIDGVIRKNVYVFKQVGNLTLPTSELKTKKLPTSNMEDNNNLNKEIDLGSESSSNFKNSYSTPKNLADMISSIDNKICDELRSKSGRSFSDNFIVQLVLKMSKNPKITATFNYLKGFIAYMAKALQYEKHDAVKTGNINFRFKTNIPALVNNGVTTKEEQHKIIPLKLPDGVWGNICQKLVDVYDQYTYKNWFSKLTPIIDEHNRTIELKTSSTFVKSWIESNYEDTLRKIIVKFRMEFAGIK